ncbi:hypothetical protein FOXB_11383 [Fusarium oxysporum f. sp. conglutinans Fo5176]|uniref:Uncharacterized protein n=1 Tax=Fusarium oxysporum (strain Fo5176) TaxID=660025 RepID=F9FYA1_FUSOF|nr:hypothetical protein FOXB_11383 [Fusarium oxysporum f. sp. conglutinans Fo5176]
MSGPLEYHGEFGLVSKFKGIAIMHSKYWTLIALNLDVKYLEGTAIGVRIMADVTKATFVQKEVIYVRGRSYLIFNIY